MNYLTKAPLWCLAFCGLVGTAQAGGTNVAYVVDRDDVLYSLDLTSGATGLIGQIDEPYVYHLLLSDSGRLYGQHDADPGFIEIDTGSGMVVGGVDPDTFFDGDFLGEQLIGARQTNIFNIDTVTGVSSDYLGVTFPGDYLQFTAFTIVDSEQAYALIDNGQFLAPDLLVSVDLATGNLTEIGLLDHGTFMAGLEYVNGQLIAVDRDGLILDVSVEDGSYSQIADIGFDVDGFAAIPAPGSIAALGFAGVFGRRRH